MFPLDFPLDWSRTCAKCLATRQRLSASLLLCRHIRRIPRGANAEFESPLRKSLLLVEERFWMGIAGLRLAPADGRLGL